MFSSCYLTYRTYRILIFTILRTDCDSGNDELNCEESSAVAAESDTSEESQVKKHECTTMSTIIKI